MSSNIEVGTKCGQCGRVRGKQAKQWKTCIDCGMTLCLYCTGRANARNAPPRCTKCDTVYWKAAWEAHEKKRRETPVECQVCHLLKLPDEFVNDSVPTICKACDTKEKEIKAATQAALEEATQRAWIPGTWRRVVVDGHYTYITDLPVKLGSKVLLPTPEWGYSIFGSDPWEGTVTSFISDYSGPCRTIIKICEDQ